MQGVKVLVANIAQFCKQGFGFGAVPEKSHKIQVFIGPTKISIFVV